MKLSYFDIYSTFLYLAYLVLFFRYPKRKYFILRLIFVSVVGFMGNSLMDKYLFTVFNPWVMGAQFLTTYIVWAIAAAVCFKVQISDLLFSATSALALEQIAAAVKDMIFIGWHFSEIVSQRLLASFLEIFVVYSVIYTVFAILLYKFFNDDSYQSTAQSPFSKFISVLIIFFCLIINRFIKLDGGLSLWSVKIAHSLYSILCSVFALFLQFGLGKILSLKREMVIMQSLVRSDKEKNEEWQEYYNQFNIRLHDIRHLMDDYKEKDTLLQKMYESVANSEHNVNTGNSVLDVLIYEKGHICENRKINFTHMVNGKAVSCLNELDIYSLFANLLDNAIAAVSGLEEEKRVISLTLNSAGDMAILHIDNYFASPIVWEGDLPKSTSDDDTHGFGMKSIQKIVNKYQGKITCTTEGQLFKIDIFVINKATES